MSLFLVGMDVTIVNVALPSIGHELHSGMAGMQWIMDSYTLVVASLLLLAGSLSDRYGRRRTFQIGLTVFTLGSVLCSVAPNIGGLIGFRALQGLGASMLNPVALSIITNTFQEPKARARAVGVWGAVSGISLALGPLLGGALTQTVGWRAIFWINAPIGIAAILLAARFVPESKAPHARRFDPVGQLLVFSTLAALTYAIIEAPARGWTATLILLLLAVTAVSLTLLLLYEPRRREPLLDLRFFRSVPFSSAIGIALCAFACFAAFLFLNALYLQQVRGLPAFRTGLYTLPLAAMIMVTAPLSGRLVGSRGPRPSLLIAGAAFLLSALLLTQLTAATSLLHLFASYLFFGVGLGMVNPAITNSAVSGMPRAQAGVAAAVASTGRQVGASLGVAVAGTIVAGSQMHGSRADFTPATHPIYWIMCGCATAVLLLGFASATGWARQSTVHVASLLDTA
jgi:EmrB/QacA subfamily drug resistance transporter